VTGVGPGLEGYAAVRTRVGIDVELKGMNLVERFKLELWSL